MYTTQSQASFRDGLQPCSSDVFIAIMGVTGSGKSTFISRCCNKIPAIGHNLQACTTIVDVYPCQLSPATTVYLIDTPGFDDTNRSDNEVLCEIASWLTASYTAKIRLSGIIYLHRISDQRMQGSAKKNLFMFKKLCGPDALKHVILATTMWDRVSDAEGQAREKELTSTPDFWGWMVSQGSRVYRHADDKESALRLIETLAHDNSQVTLALQQQMANENKSLEETDAGKELHSEIIKERKKFEKSLAEVQEQTAEALKARDKDSERALREVQEDYKDRIRQLERSRQNLKIDMEELHRQQARKLEAKLQEAENRHEDQLRQMKRDGARKEAELLREKQKAEQRHLKMSAELKKLQLQENVYTPASTQAPSPKSVSKHEVSLAISGDSFVFSGPKGTIREWRPRKGGHRFMDNYNFNRFTAIGENDSWMTIGKSGEAEWSRNMERNYPGFTRSWNNHTNETEHASKVVLGTNGEYFIRDTGCRRHRSYHLHAAIKMKGKDCRNIDTLAFGQYGSYIVGFNNGILWDVSDVYFGLHEWITKKVDEEERILRAAALSLTDEYAVVVFDDGSAWVHAPDYYRECWRSWVTSHYGTDFFYS